MLPCPRGQNGRSISTGRFPVDESTVRLFVVIFESLAIMVKGMRCHRFPQSLIVRSTSPHCSLFGIALGGWSKSYGAFFHRVPRLPLGEALPRIHWTSVRFATLHFLFFASRCSRRRSASWMSSARPMGINRNSRASVSKNAAHCTYC